MISGYGDGYRQGLADWHAIIDGLVKPTFDGVLPLTDLASAIDEARAAAKPDPRQAALKRRIAEIRSAGAGRQRRGGVKAGAMRRDFSHGVGVMVRDNHPDEIVNI